MKIQDHKNRGFTLIELIVSVAIFTVVMVVALGALLGISAGARKAETLKSVMNNLNFAIESMSRTLRSSYDWRCSATAGADCTSGSNLLKVMYPQETEYRFETNGALCNQSGTAGCITRSINGGTPIPLTAPEVVITSLNFYLVGSQTFSNGDSVQPKVTMTVSGYVQVSAGQQSTFNLQTSITQRLYDQ